MLFTPQPPSYYSFHNWEPVFAFPSPFTILPIRPTSGHHQLSVLCFYRSMSAFACLFCLKSILSSPRCSQQFRSLQTDFLWQHYSHISVPSEIRLPALQVYIAVHFWLWQWLPTWLVLLYVSLPRHLFNHKYSLICHYFPLWPIIVLGTEQVFSNAFPTEFLTQSISALKSVLLGSSCMFPSKLFQLSFVKKHI